MSKTEFDFQRVINPIESSEFFSKYWEKQPLVISRNDPDFYSDLLTMKDIDYIISSTDLRHPAFRLIKNGSQIPIQKYTTEFTLGNETVSKVADVDRLLSEYEQGATIALQALHRNWRPLSLLCRNLEKLFNYPTQTNIYLTPKASQGFDPHYDTHDVFVLQIEGTKHWRIYDTPTLLPDRSQPWKESETEIGNPLYEFDLNAGDLIYMPRGYIHEGLTSEKHSLHITLGILVYTWAEIFIEALSLCRNDQRFRRSVPIGLGERNEISPEIKAEFEELKHVFSNSTTLEAVIEKISDRFVSKRHPILDGHLLELNRIDNLDSQTIIRRRANVIHKITLDDNSVVLLYHGKKLIFPRYVETAIRFIVEANDFKTGDISSPIDIAGKLTLVRRLIKEGFLVVV